MPKEAEQPEALLSALVELKRANGLLLRDVARQLNIQPVIPGKLLGIPMPGLREVDSRAAVNLNARMDWSKSRVYT